LEELKKRPWPGNVRELQNVVERALLLADGAVIGPDDLPGDVLRLPRASDESEPDLLPGQTLADARDAFERRLVTRILSECRGNVSRAADRLGLDRTTLHRRLKAWGLGGSGLDFTL
ncbi:MAG: sigma-54-dependent Fis family transcriptional regulator, partial [Deltaproteobacteria bacterium]|nr:sigma-54-dependent Fis family transcriptional regulator [Deltaproteobacteria bacterium]